jgi:hypothetical protein
VYSELGVDDNGFREDWALVKLKEYEVKNGEWWGLDEFPGVCHLTKPLQSPLLEFNGQIIGAEDSALGLGEPWFKDGAQTGWTVGHLSSTEVLLFLRGTTMAVNGITAARLDNIQEAKVLMFGTAIEGETFAEPGDSGSGLFRVSDDAKNFIFGGHIISVFGLHGGQNMVMGVPQSQFTQIETKMVMKWRIM